MCQIFYSQQLVENKPTEIYNIVVKRAVVSKMTAVDYDDSLYIILIIYY